MAEIFKYAISDRARVCVRDCACSDRSPLGWKYPSGILGLVGLLGLFIGIRGICKKF